MRSAALIYNPLKMYPLQPCCQSYAQVMRPSRCKKSFEIFPRCVTTSMFLFFSTVAGKKRLVRRRRQTGRAPEVTTHNRVGTHR